MAYSKQLAYELLKNKNFTVKLSPETKAWLEEETNTTRSKSSDPELQSANHNTDVSKLSQRDNKIEQTLCPPPKTAAKKDAEKKAQKSPVTKKAKPKRTRKHKAVPTTEVFVEHPIVPSRKPKENFIPKIPGEIARVVLGLEKATVEITITNNYHVQDVSKHIYYKERSVAMSILQALANADDSVSFAGTTAKILSYSASQEFQNQLIVLREFAFSDTLVDIWIYKLKVPCPKHPEMVENVTAYVRTDQGTNISPINVFYCYACNKYYINAEQYQSFAKKYGLPMIRLRAQDSSTNDLGFENWEKESLLHILGYNVRTSDNLSSIARQRILIHALETNMLSKSQIISFLERILHLNRHKPNLANACQKWQDDLGFIRNYNLDHQQTVNGRFIMKK